MNKIQVQLPSPLYARLKGLAKKLDYSMAELLRRGAEQIVIYYAHHDEPDSSKNMPTPRRLGLKIADPRNLRELAHERT